MEAGEEEEELTVMKVIVDGESNGKNIRVDYSLLDKYDTKAKPLQ